MVIFTTDNLWLIAYSFCASVGFGLVFRIIGTDLLLAGIGGVLSRIVYIILLSFIPNRLVYMSIAAFFAGLYGEFMATIRKEPSTYFIYPALIPLIPGDLLYYTLISIFTNGYDVMWENSTQCIMALMGLSIGFVLSSSFMHHLRRYNFYEKIRKTAFRK